MKPPTIQGQDAAAFLHALAFTELATGDRDRAFDINRLAVWFSTPPPMIVTEGLKLDDMQSPGPIVRSPRSEAIRAETQRQRDALYALLRHAPQVFTEPPSLRPRLATLRCRTDPKFGEPRPELLALDGEKVKVRYGWKFDEDERPHYREVGDVAWAVIEPADFPVGWIATGDLVFEDERGEEPEKPPEPSHPSRVRVRDELELALGLQLFDPREAGPIIDRILDRLIEHAILAGTRMSPLSFLRGIQEAGL